MLALVASNKWFIKQLDVNNVFLHGDLNEEVYIVLPPGMKSTKPGQVCKLQRSLYGLKQASRQWYAQLSTFLVAHGFKQSVTNYSLFTLKRENSFIALLIYVDDIVLSGNDLSVISHITKLLDDTFKMKDLGNLEYFLGFEVARGTSGINICQRKYALDLLTDTDMLNSKPVSTPFDYCTRLHQSFGSLLFDTQISSYRRLIVRLIYLTNTKPDITFAVQHLSQFIASLTIAHYMTLYCILQYIKVAPSLGIFFPSTSEFQLKAFSDSDWAGCIEEYNKIGRAHV